MNKTMIFVIIGAALVFLGVNSVFTVHQTQKGLVLEFGKPVGEPVGPGVHFKWFYQNVMPFDCRVLDIDTIPAEVNTLEKKALLVDNYTKWRIVNPLVFYRNLKSVAEAQGKIDAVVKGKVRDALGRYTLVEIVSKERTEIMQEVLKQSAEAVKFWGVELLDVRIKRTDLPPENQRAIFGRMRAERKRQATRYRSEGKEESAKIRSAADKDKTILIAEAQRKSEVLRGEGDAEATRIYAEAFEQSPEFYAFKRSLDAYVAGFDSNTRMIITPENRFLRFIR